MVDRAKVLSVIADMQEGVSLRAACKKHDVLSGTFIFWIRQDDDLAKQYARAKEISLDLMAEELIEIADDGSNDWMAKNDPSNPGYAFNGEASARSRLRVDTRKWYMSKLAPKRYGDKLAVTGGNDDDAPIRLQHSIGGEAAELVAELLKGIEHGE